MKDKNNISARGILRTILRVTSRVLVMLLLVYLGLGLVLFVFQAKYIFHPDKTAFEDCDSFSKAERISFDSGRGYLTRRSPENVIVFYHGNAGRACDRDFMDSFFARRNFSTYFVEYSGYGEAGNSPSMEKLLANADDTIAFLKTQHFRKIIVIGESVGAGPAAYHASRANIDRLILIAAYDDLASVAFSHYPLYPTRFLLRHNFTPQEWLSGYQGKVTVILAGDDRVIPRSSGERLYESIPSDKKTLYTVEGAGHNTIYDTDAFYSFLHSSLQLGCFAP